MSKCLKMNKIPVNQAWRPDGMAVQRTTRVAQLDACPQVVSGIGDRFYHPLINKVMMVYILLITIILTCHREPDCFEVHTVRLSKLWHRKGSFSKHTPAAVFIITKAVPKMLRRLSLRISVILVMMRMVIKTTIGFYVINKR